MSTPLPKQPAASPMVGGTLGKYELRGLIGEGGMGKVYEAVNTTINKRVALKCIDMSLVENADVLARFQREALAAGAVDSPYIVQIFDAGQAQGIPFIVMELLRGRDLGSLIRSDEPFDANDAVAVTCQALRGLADAHDAGIVHRDLKPDNVFLSSRKDEPVRVKLLDFGVSKIARSGGAPLKTLTRQGVVVGTPHYMSPEQAQALPSVDHRTDIYSLGAMLYECLAGKPPHDGDSYEQVIVNICMHDAPDIRKLNDGVSEQLAAVVHRALARDPRDRYDTAAEMRAALETVLTDSSGSVATPRLRITVDSQTPAHAATVAAAMPPQAVAHLDSEVPAASGPVSGITTVPQAPLTAAMESAATEDAELELAGVPQRGSIWPAVAAAVAALVVAGLAYQFGSTPDAEPVDVGATSPTTPTSAAALNEAHTARPAAIVSASAATAGQPHGGRRTGAPARASSRRVAPTPPRVATPPTAPTSARPPLTTGAASSPKSAPQPAPQPTGLTIQRR